MRHRRRQHTGGTEPSSWGVASHSAQAGQAWSEAPVAGGLVQGQLNAMSHPHADGRANASSSGHSPTSSGGSPFFPISRGASQRSIDVVEDGESSPQARQMRWAKRAHHTAGAVAAPAPEPYVEAAPPPVVSGLSQEQLNALSEGSVLHTASATRVGVRDTRLHSWSLYLVILSIWNWLGRAVCSACEAEGS